VRVKSRSLSNLHTGNDLNRWTISFADFMTLMFAVFVMLYAVAMSKEEKYKDVIQSIQTAGKLLSGAVLEQDSEQILTKQNNIIIEQTEPALSSDQNHQQAKAQLSKVDSFKKGKELTRLKSDLENILVAGLANQSIKLNLEKDWLTIEMGSDLLFVGGSHTLLTSGKEQLVQLAKVLIPINNMLRIRGYTDPESISNEIYSSNWELSGARAFAVLHALNRQGVQGNRMVMEAYGPYTPVLDKNDRVNNEKSRRVVIAISKYAVVEAKIDTVAEQASKSKAKSTLPAINKTKTDSKTMHEIHLPNNRLIITTRQE